MANIASAMTRLADADARAGCDVVFVTTDPARDTAPVLRAYLDHVRPDVHRPHRRPAATSSRSASRSASASTQGEKLPSGGYDVTHGTTDHRRSTTGDRAPVVWTAGAPPRRSAPPTSTRCSTRGTDRMMLTLLSIPSPSQGVWHLGPLPDPRPTRCASSSASSPRSGSASGAGWPAADGPARSATSRSGRCRSAWSAAGSTTWSPTTTSTSARASTPSRRSTSGTAASASGARSRSARARRLHRRPPQGDPAAAGRRRAGPRRAASPRRIGRWGNWFNQELFGKPTDLPWGLEIDPDEPAGRLLPVRHLPPDLPLRVPVEPRGVRAA